MVFCIYFYLNIKWWTLFFLVLLSSEEACHESIDSNSLGELFWYCVLMGSTLIFIFLLFKVWRRKMWYSLINYFSNFFAVGSGALSFTLIHIYTFYIVKNLFVSFSTLSSILLSIAFTIIVMNLTVPGNHFTDMNLPNEPKKV